MAATGVTEDEYSNFLQHGGTLRFEVNGNDIDSSLSFEKSPLIEPLLTTGFEIKPTDIASDDEIGMHMLLYGSSWTKVIFLYESL